MSARLRNAPREINTGGKTARERIIAGMRAYLEAHEHYYKPKDVVGLEEIMTSPFGWLKIAELDADELRVALRYALVGLDP